MEYPKLEDLNPSSCTERSIRIHWPEFYEYIKYSYNWCSKFTESLYCFYHKLERVPKCECGNPLKFINLMQGYQKFCSRKCADSSNKTKYKRTQTFLKRYGKYNPMQIESVKEKIKKTNLKKYGTENVFASQVIKEKIRNTNKERYGVDYPMSNKDILNKSMNTIKEKYGVPWNCQRKEAKNFSNNSKPNRDFAKLLDDNNIEYEREYSIDKYSFDFKVKDILIEINPSATHNSTWGIFSKKPLDKKYHLNKSEYAKKSGFRCLHVWDWDDKEKIINLLKDRINIGARKCIIKEVDKKECNEFLNKYHLQNTCNGQKVRLGLYYNDELVEIMTFGIPRYNKSYDWELLRLCSIDKYNIIGGASKLFKFFIDNYKPKNIISYCDNSKFDGTVYNELGFDLIRNRKPSKHWYDGKKHITDNLLKQRGFDKLFNCSFGKGTSNKELMLEYGFVEVYDCGQSTYVLKID